jgi:hypothetical protein
MIDGHGLCPTLNFRETYGDSAKLHKCNKPLLTRLLDMSAQFDGPVVVGVGIGRTGTNSMQRALEILGLDPCYHGFRSLPSLIPDKSANKVCELSISPLFCSKKRQREVQGNL